MLPGLAQPVSQALTGLTIRWPRIAAYLLRPGVLVQEVEDPAAVAYATLDGKIHINQTRFGPGTEFPTWGEIAYVLAHEVLHIAYRDVQDMASDPSLDRAVANIAMDVVRNALLDAARIGRRPAGAVTWDALVRARPDLAGRRPRTPLAATPWRVVYNLLMQDQQDQQDQRGRKGSSGLAGDVIVGVHASDSKPAADADAAASDVRRAMIGILDKTAGAHSADIVRTLAGAEVVRPRWDDAFAEVIRYVRGSGPLDFRRPVKPYWERTGIAMFHRRTPALSVGIVVDTSGSVSARELGKFLGAALDLCRVFRITAAYVAAVDDGLRGVWPCDLDSGDAADEIAAAFLKLKGGGGTSFRGVIAALSEVEAARDMHADAFLFATDGYTGSWPAADEFDGRPVVWALSDRQCPMPPFGVVASL